MTWIPRRSPAPPRPAAQPPPQPPPAPPPPRGAVLGYAVAKVTGRQVSLTSASVTEREEAEAELAQWRSDCTRQALSIWREPADQRQMWRLVEVRAVDGGAA